jgi:hypothetical protein
MSAQMYPSPGHVFARAESKSSVGIRSTSEMREVGQSALGEIEDKQIQEMKRGVLVVVRS